MRELGHDHVTFSELAGGWRIYQLKRGHRWATDDLLTAWRAIDVCPDVPTPRLLDLGCGIGSVGLLMLLRLPHAKLVAVEAQTISAHLFRRTLEANNIAAPVTVIENDLREAGLLDEYVAFDLITANPPYITPGKGRVSPHPQRAAARLELRGDIFDYCRLAKQKLAPGGRFVFCHSASDARPERAIDRAGLRLLQRQDVIFRKHKTPTIALFVCAHEGDRQDEAPLLIRDEEGVMTARMHGIRREMLIEA
jgi:tRNA1Val (adenine37-N6)-methyltransferase